MSKPSGRKKPRLTTTTVDLGGGKKLQQTTEDTGEDYEEEDGEGGKGHSQPTPHEKVKFEDVATEKTKTNRRCYGCDHLFGKQKVHGKVPALDLLWETYVDNRETMSEEALAYLISKTHEREIVKPKLESANEIDYEHLLWLPDEVLIHFRSHMIDAKRTMQSMIRDMDILASTLKDTVYSTPKGSNERNHDHQTILLLLKINTERANMLAKFKNL